MRSFTIFTVAALSACGLDISDPPGDGFLDVLVEIDGTDTTIEGIGVTLVRVEALVASPPTAEERRITILDEPRDIAVPRPSFGIPYFVVRGAVPAGEVRQIRFVVQSAFVRVSGATETVEFEVIVPSGPQTGIKGVPRHGVSVTVSEGQITRALTTIDLDTQLHRPPGRGFMLKPTADLTTADRPTLSDSLAANEVILSTMLSSYPETGVTLERAKVIDTTTGVTRDIVIDQNGVARDLAAVIAAEVAAYRAAHGAIEPLLLDELASIPPERPLTLTMLIVVPPDRPFEAPGNVGSLDPVYEAFHAQLEAAHRAFIDDAVAAIEAAGGVVTRRDDLTAALEVRASAETTRNVLAFLPQIAAVDIVRPVSTMAVTSARDLVESAILPFYQSVGGQAAQVRIVIEEPDCADLTISAFSNAIVEAPIGTGTGNQSQVNHATGVASVAAGTFSSGFSGAYRSRLRPVCSLGFGPVVGAMPTVVNESFLTSAVPSTPERQRDREIFISRFFLANGAGNTSDTKCHLYNSVCVGGYDAHGTFGVANFSDDTPAFAYVNFTGTGREQPLLVASAVGVTVAKPTGLDTVSGTSFATPAISGMAALIVAIFPGLRTEPTMVRAALMASARHNIAGPPVPIFGDAIDDPDGAGAPRGDRLMQILLNWAFDLPWLQGGILDRDVDFDANGELVVPFHVDAGEHVRVALTWDVCPYTVQVGVYDHLTIDLDLVVEGPLDSAGQPVAFKANPSMADNYEVLDFLAFFSGEWKIRIQAPSWQGCADLGAGSRRTFYGLAFDVGPLLE